MLFIRLCSLLLQLRIPFLFVLSGLSSDGKNLDRNGVLGGVLNGSSFESSNSSIDAGFPRIVDAADAAAAAAIFGSLVRSNVLFRVLNVYLVLGLY